MLKVADATKLNRNEKFVKMLDNLDIFIKARKADIEDIRRWMRSLDNLADGGDYVVEYVTPDGLIYKVRMNDDFRVNINLMDEAGDTLQDSLRVGKRHKIKPSLAKGSKPKGNPTAETKQTYVRQNESANLLASKGYDVTFLDEMKDGNGYGISKKLNPDFLIEEKVFDCYAPGADTSAKTIIREIAHKTKEQAPNIVLNLDDYAGNSIVGTVTESSPDKSRLNLSTDGFGEAADSGHSRPIFYSGGGTGYSGCSEIGDTMYLYFLNKYEETRSVIAGGGTDYKTFQSRWDCLNIEK